ncbi:MAG: hypothetical protein QM723_30975 [Myxococcaceae bacterium]
MSSRSPLLNVAGHGLRADESLVTLATGRVHAAPFANGRPPALLEVSRVDSHSYDWSPITGSPAPWGFYRLKGDLLLAHIPDDVWAAESILRIAWQVVTHRLGGVLMHGCAVSWDGQGVAAIGVSGAGKSTLATLSAGHPAHALLLTDEIVQLFPDGTVWGTPFRSNVENVGAPGPAKLKSLLLLEKGDHEALTPVAPADALGELLPQLYAPMAGVAPRGEAVRRVMEIADKAGVHRLTFRKDPAVGPFLQKWAAPGSRVAHPEAAAPSRVAGHEVAAILEGQQPGKQMWISVRGRSMWPLLSGGEALRVRRCNESDLKPGDVVVLVRDDGQLIAHIVAGVDPLRTESFLGVPDAPGLKPLAKAELARHGDRDIPLERVRPFIRVAQRSLSRAAQSPLVRRAWDSSRRWLGSETSGAIRARLLSPTVRRVQQTELPAFAVALSRWETLNSGELEQMVNHRAAAGVWARGTLAGVGVHGDDGTIRHLHLKSWLRNAGAGERLLEELWQPSVNRVEVGEEEQEIVSAAERRGLAVTGRTDRGALILGRR